MSRARANFTSQELVQVLSHYNIGIIQKVVKLTAGSRRAPKRVVVSDSGVYLLKRRSHGKDDPYRVSLAHAIQKRLEAKDYPVAKLITTRDQQSTFLHLEDHIYELFEFVKGTRYDKSTEETIEAGSALAIFHNDMADFKPEIPASAASFHDSHLVRNNLKKIGADNNPTFHSTIDRLLQLYNNSSVQVNQLGFDEWPRQIVHGDWHPGNLIYRNGKIKAVLDFDSVKLTSPIIDLANGLLQFSIVAGRPSPLEWPDYLDIVKFEDFLDGYRTNITLTEEILDAITDLMIETMIAETVLPIAATGFFGYFSGSDFLSMILRKCDWINKNRESLSEAIHQ